VIETAFFVLLWVTLPALWYVGLMAARIRLTNISIPSFLIFVIFIFQYLGLPLLYFKIDQYRVDEVTDTALVFDVFIYLGLAISFLILGFLIGRAFCKGNFGFISYSKAPMAQKSSDKVFSLAMLFIGIFVLYKYIDVIGLERIALFSLFSNLDSSSTTLMRSQMGNDFDGRYYIYKFFFRDILNVSSFCLFSLYLSSKKRMALFWFSLSFVISAISALIAVEKGPVLAYFIGLLLCYLLIRNHGQINLVAGLKTLVLISIVASFSYVFTMGAGDPLEGLTQAASRAFTGQIQPAYHYLEIFPEKVGYLLGKSFPNPREIFPFQHYQLTVEVMNIIQPWHITEGVVGTMPTIFWGELYANFGALGVVLGSIFAGIVIYVFSNYICMLPCSPFTIAVYVWFIQHIGELATTSLSNYIVDFYSFGVILITMLYLLVSRPERSHSCPDTAGPGSF
jgi:oligosaccharide repeat unit polymerase